MIYFNMISLIITVTFVSLYFAHIFTSDSVTAFRKGYIRESFKNRCKTSEQKKIENILNIFSCITFFTSMVLLTISLMENSISLIFLVIAIFASCNIVIIRLKKYRVKRI